MLIVIAITQIGMLQCGEMAQILGISLLSGCQCLPEEHHYWSTQGLDVSIASKTISRNCFYSIKKCFHVEYNNNLEPGNEISKVSTLFKFRNDSLTKFEDFSSHVSIDESTDHTMVGTVHQGVYA